MSLCNKLKIGIFRVLYGLLEICYPNRPFSTFEALVIFRVRILNIFIYLVVTLDSCKSRNPRKMQKKAVRMVSGLTGQTYEERLIELNLPTLEMRRCQSDMILTFEIIRSIDAVDTSSWLNLVGENPPRHTRLTSNPLNIIASRSNPGEYILT